MFRFFVLEGLGGRLVVGPGRSAVRAVSWSGGSRLLELHQFCLGRGKFLLERLQFARIIHLLPGAGHLLAKLAEPLVERLDSFLGLLIHGYSNICGFGSVIASALQSVGQQGLPTKCELLLDQSGLFPLAVVF